MAVDKKSIARLKLIDDVLSWGEFSLDELCDYVNDHLDPDLNISRRTLQDDLRFMEEAFDVRIQRRQYGHKKKLSIIPGYNMFSKRFSQEEKDLLQEILQTLGLFEGVPAFEWLDRLSRSLKLDMCLEKRKIIHFSSVPLYTNLLGLLFHYINRCMVIDLAYRTFVTPDVKRISVKPYLLRQYNNRWFLIAGAVEDGALLNFPLDRIEEVVPIGKFYKEEEVPDTDRFFQDVIGVTVYRDKEPEEILFWTDKLGFCYLSTKPLHSSMSEVTDINEITALKSHYPSLPEGHFVRLKVQINWELKQQLTTYLNEIVVLEPVSLRNNLQEIFGKMFQMYNEINIYQP